MRVSVFRTVRRGLPRSPCIHFLFLACAIVAPTAASAESMGEALSSAYVTNPTLNAARAQQRSVDEQIPIANADLLPDVKFNADRGQEVRNLKLSEQAGSGLSSVFSEGKTRPAGYSFTLNQNLFRGFRTISAIREAKANIFAGIENLRNSEQTTLLNGATAYIDVLQNQAIVRLQENNVKVLREQLKATQDRFEVGEVTRTDVAQSQASLSSAISQLSLARSNLKTARANYEEVIGHPPSDLSQPTPIDGLLPTDQQSALAMADEESPTILNAIFLAEASRYAVKELVGELLPEVTFEAEHQFRFEPSRTVEEQETTTFVGRVNVPLYQGGGVAAQVRQAKEVNRQRLDEVVASRTQVRADVVSAWGQLVAARAQIESDESAVNANNIALRGVREEERVGQRTVLDVLDAEQTLLDSQVNLVTSKRDKVVAAYTVLQSVGRLDSYTLNLPVQHYDPLLHYRKAKFKLLGLNPDRGSLIFQIFNSGDAYSNYPNR